VRSPGPSALAGACALALALVGVAGGQARAATLEGRVEAGGRGLGFTKVTAYASGPARSRMLAADVAGRRGAFALRFKRPRRASAVVYLVAAGGSAPANPRQIRLLAVAGLADELPRRLRVNELTTVAAAYSLARFLRGVRVAGPSPGLPNAAGTVRNLVTARGTAAQAITTSPNGPETDSLATFNTLANIVGGCVRGTPRGCRRLFRAARPAGERGPRDTLAAVHRIALDPASKARRIFRLRKPPVFRPRLQAAPSSWVLTLKHTDGEYNGPGRMAFDSQGNIWVTNNFLYPPPSTASGPTVIGLDPTGAPRPGNPFSGGGILGAWWGIAVDAADRVWLSNFTGNDPNDWNDPGFEGGDNVALLGPDGDPISTDAGYTEGPFLGPQGIAVSQNGDVWFANHTSDTVVRYRGGDHADSQLISGGGLHNPFAIEIDADGNAWVDNGSLDPSAEGSVTKIDPDGQIVDTYPVPEMRSPQGIAFDSAGDLWIASLEDDNVTWLDPEGNVRDQFRVPSIEGPWSIAIDGDDNVWVASFVGRKVTKLCGGPSARCPRGLEPGDPISPPLTGFGNGGLQHITAVQVDQSGNVWAANNWAQISPTIGGDGLVEFIGAAAPVKTPLIGPPEPPG
jgi:sugar lactone lactonase YvrE